MGVPTPIVADPPTGSIGAILQLPESLERLMFGQNVDMTPEDFLLHAGTSYAQRVDHHIQQYRATIYTIGMIAGVAGSPDEQEAVRSAITDAVTKYGATLSERNQREHWYSKHGSVLDILSSTHGAINATVGGATELIGSGLESAGNLIGNETVSNAGDAVEGAGADLMQTGIDTIYTDYDGVIEDLIKDLWSSIVTSAKEWWDWFERTRSTEGLIIALGQAQVDASFIAAEIAIDIGIGVLTAGWGAAAFRSIRVVGRRVINSGTDVVIKLVREGADTIDVKHLHHVDSDIPSDIQQKVPDLEEMQGHPAAEVDTTPNADAPTTTRVAGARGTNEAEWTTVNGRATEVDARLREDFGETDRSRDEINAQNTVRNQGGIDGDHAGHMIGHRYTGDQGTKNLFPQQGNFNTSAYKKIENEWGRAINAGYEVQVHVKLTPPGSTRPDQVEVRWQYYDNDGNLFGEAHREVFHNGPGQTYDGTSFRTR